MIRVVLLLVTLTLEASVFIKNLKNSETKKLESLISGKSLTIIFQPNCSACKHQVQSLSCIKEDIKILLLGAFSNEKKLLKEYQKFKVNYPSFYASKDILKKLKITSSATPQIIYFNNQRATKHIGYKSCINLQSFIEKTKQQNTI